MVQTAQPHELPLPRQRRNGEPVPHRLAERAQHEAEAAAEVVGIAGNGRSPTQPLQSAEVRRQINREPIVESQFGEKIHDLMTARSEKLVFFDVDDDANYGDAMHLMDVARGAGAKTLGIMTK